MTYWIVALIVLFILAPMARLWPSAKDRQAMEGRRVAMKRGVGVELTRYSIRCLFKISTRRLVECRLNQN